MVVTSNTHGRIYSKVRSINTESKCRVHRHTIRLMYYKVGLNLRAFNVLSDQELGVQAKTRRQSLFTVIYKHTSSRNS